MIVKPNRIVKLKWKQIIACLLAAMLLTGSALAEVYAGTVAARSTMALTAEAGGVLEELNVQSGSRVCAGESIARVSTQKVFATQDGTIARIQAEEGDDVRGTVLEISPVSRYTVYCTADGGYSSPAAGRLRCGERLYLYCTNNGTHQGSGIVTSIDGETYMVEAIGGEFYVGETLYLYRDPQFRYKYLVGVGTVVVSDTEAYEAEGRLTALHVSEGEYVERGELLYELIDGESAELSATADGVIVECAVQEGETVREGDVIALLAPNDEFCVRIDVEETELNRIQVGDRAELLYACSPEEETAMGEVIEISSALEDGLCAVYIRADEAPQYLGMSVSVRIG